VSRSVALVCRVETGLCAIPVEHVREIMRPLPIAPLAEMPRFVRGVAVVRGVPIPVIDAATLLGAISFRHPGRFVALRSNARSAAPAVESVLGVRDLSTASIHALPLRTIVKGRLGIRFDDGKLGFLAEASSAEAHASRGVSRRRRKERGHDLEGANHFVFSHRP
jgi:hypothetical protein